MKVEQFRHNGSVYMQTEGVSKLLPEDKIIELYNLGKDARKPMQVVQLHQTYYGPPVITVTSVKPIIDETGRRTVENHTFLISLKNMTDELLEALRPFFHRNEKLEPLNLEFRSG